MDPNTMLNEAAPRPADRTPDLTEIGRADRSAPPAHPLGRGAKRRDSTVEDLRIVGWVDSVGARGLQPQYGARSSLRTVRPRRADLPAR